MLIFCRIRSPSLCTLALHIAGSLWRLDFNHSSLFRHPLAPTPPSPPSGPFPRSIHSIYMHNCLWSIYSSPLGLPLARERRCDSNNIFPVGYLPSRIAPSRVFSDSHMLLASPASFSSSLPHVASLKSSFFSLVKPVNFAAPRGRAK